MVHQLHELPYPYDALEPHIDARTMEIHHTKHHNAYVTNLNKALEEHADLQGRSLEELLASLESLPGPIRTAVVRSADGHGTGRAGRGPGGARGGAGC